MADRQNPLEKTVAEIRAEAKEMAEVRAGKFEADPDMTITLSELDTILAKLFKK